MTALAKIKTIALSIALALAVFSVVGGLVWIGSRFLPRRDVTTAVQTARADEGAARKAADGVGTQVARANDDATIHLELTTKEIHDAFSTLPAPVPSPTAGSEPRAIPAAPIDRLRDRLNEGAARANRAAGPADPES